MKHFIRVAAVAAVTTGLAACGGGGGSSSNRAPVPSANNSGGAGFSLGVFTNATVNFFAADGTTQVGSGETDGSGDIVSVSTGSYSGPLVIQIAGDDDAQYFDESTGMLEDFPDGSSVWGFGATGGNVAVTPLTDIAYRAAVRNGLLPISSGETTELYNIIATALLGGIDISTLPAVADTANSMDFSADDAGRYALVLAALAYMGGDGSDDPADGTAPALAVLNALLIDLKDGTIDDLDASTPPEVVPPAYVNFASEFSAALNAAAANYAGADLLDEVNNGDNDYETVSTDLTALNDVEDDGQNTGGGGGGGSSCANSTTVDSSGCQALGNTQGVTGTFSGNDTRTLNFFANSSEGIGGTITIFAGGMPPAIRTSGSSA